MKWKDGWGVFWFNHKELGEGAKVTDFFGVILGFFHLLFFGYHFSVVKH
jgi:hypothetical protein